MLRRVLLLGVTAIAALLTWWARWNLHFSNYTGIVVSSRLAVVRIFSDGPAARSEIRPGDRVLAIDGRRIANLTDYLAVMRDPHLKGRELSVDVRRGGEDVALRLGVAAYPVLHLTGFGPICGVLVLVFGLYVYMRKSRDPASGLYLLLSVCLSVLLILSNHLLKAAPSPLPFLLWGTALIAVVPLNLHFYLVFPERKGFLQARPRILPALYIVPGVFLIALVAITAGIEWNLRRGLDSGPGFDRLRFLFLAYFVAAFATCPVFIASLVHSLVRASTAERRRQVQVVLTGATATLFFAGLAVAGLLWYLGNPEASALWPAWTFNVLYAVIVLATVVLPASMAVAILKYRLWDLDRTLYGTMNCTLLSAALLGLGLVILGVFGWLFGEVVKPASYLPILVFTLTVAAILDPLRHLVQRVVDRTLNPGAHVSQETLRAFSREVTTIRRIEPLATRLSQVVAGALGVKRVAVALKDDENPAGWRIAAAVGANEEEKTRLLECARAIEELTRGTPNATSLRLDKLSDGNDDERLPIEAMRAAGIELAIPIRHNGTLSGCLLLAPRGGVLSFTRDDCRMLETLANQTAVAAENAQLNESLEAHVAKVEELNRDLAAKVTKVDDLNRGLNAELTANEELRRSIQAELTRNEALALSLQGQLTANEKLTADLKAQLRANESLNVDRQAQLTANEKLTSELKTQLAANAKQLAEIRDLNTSLEAKIGTIEAQKAEILRLQELLLRENSALKARLAGEFRVGEIVGAAGGLKKVMAEIAKVAATDATVLILGETGTGKELVARALHANSRRAREAFVAVNTAMLTEQLQISEFFGHEKGAFTGAFERRIGRFEQADGGTVLLDEIGDISPGTQILLLRFLATREFQRLGGSETLTADVRILAATNRDLERLVREGLFREDLFYRLNVVTAVMPPLRDRPEDIRELAIYFLRRYARKHGKPITSIDEAVIERLKLHRWPGNVRELENMIERAVVLSEREILTLDDMPMELRAGKNDEGDEAAETTHKTSMREIERERLIRALEAAGGNRTEAANALGMYRTTLINKLKKHGLF